MININDAHQWILKILKKNYGGFASPGDIDRAIHSASIDLFNEQIKVFKETERVPELIKNFKSKTTGALTSDVLALSEEDAEIISIQTVVNSKNYPARIVDSDAQWISRRYEDMEMDPKTEKPLSHYLQEVEVTSNLQELPEDYICPEYAYVVEDSTSKRYEAIIMDPKMFESKKLIDVFPDLENKQISPSHLNRKEATFTGTQINAGADLPENFIKELSGSVTLASGGSYEGIIVDPEIFYSKQLLDLIGARNEGQEIFHLEKQEEAYAITSSSDQFLPLPENMVEGITIFYIDDDVYKEGDILTEREFAERVNSLIVPPTTDHPIARIVDNKIEFFPKPASGTYNYVLSYKEFPTATRPVFKIENDKIYARPTLASGDSVKLVYLAHPVLKRPIVRVVDNKIEIEPFDSGNYTYKFGFYQFPVPERALARISGDNADGEVDIEISPSGIGNINVFYFKKPTKPVFGYTASNGVVTYASGSSTDLDWGSKALVPLMTQALFYLGFIIKDGDVIEIGTARDQTIANKKQL